MCVFVLVSSQTGFSRYFRYVLPCFPFVFIYISRVAAVFAPTVDGQESRVDGRSWWRERLWLKGLVAGALIWSVASSLWVYPHSMSYFNELAGGPKGGHRYLIDANIDWGQDMWYLKEWYDEHPEARPLHMAYLCFVNPRYYGIEYEAPPQEPRPGWYAMSIHRIHGYNDKYEFFLRYEPVAMAGYSIYIYHVTLEDANRVRRELGLPLLSGEDAAADPAAAAGEP